MKSGEAASNGPSGGHEAVAADGSRPGSRSSQLDHLPPHQRPQLSGEVKYICSVLEKSQTGAKNNFEIWADIFFCFIGPEKST